jgi:hypothetical protein
MEQSLPPLRAHDRRRGVCSRRGTLRIDLSAEDARRGRRVSFSEDNPDTDLLVEGELRSAFESLARLGTSFRLANPAVDWDRLAEVGQELTRAYAGVECETVWGVATSDAPTLLHRLNRPRIPKSE